ncbi:peptidylprolyl isomerase [Elizabethkingia anophelis]|uniref:FKBP-type peptidyl-prolyl cis-trans isomerase n=1 Tax=Elizabethkingia anophelis TaxID=1117645 RepID=UPI000994A307|nr:FKBP-type peptidyl-prolyl cis-trans isomerase [Elizabethkingia anophelis]MCT4286965.1 FKBP-type peptidyl-prolyl cis-trans isomerase [Elizabethkingia anophelis]MDV3566264.1 peptidylprolyl isomerase [Elizabethkingia anophelis]MDV3855096.1 peptidylprolyl isomerase [Elizabethkingia anophelis]MDV3860060.1 peptidylprolyl isomerase [Elizabethkingia anophelis]MDV3874607.1 peptidylprolyl isomerase [Elizabethkingia anophelis]
MGVADLLLKKKKALAEKNLKEGQEFQAAFGAKEGVVTLESGLQYEILEASEGKKPGAKDSVICHYHGTTINGQVFDSSVERKKPATFPLNRVIEGWTEALQLMSTGSKWKLVIPPHLAYGNEQISKEIGPNSTLIFEVELLGIK